MLWFFINQFVVRQGLVGALLAQWLLPFYRQTREWAKSQDMSDALYFTILLSCVHTGMYVVINLRKYLCLQLMWSCIMCLVRVVEFVFVSSISLTSLPLFPHAAYFVCDTYKLFPSAKLYRKPYMEPKPDLLRRLGLEEVLGQVFVGPLMSYYAFPTLFEPFLHDFDNAHQEPTFGATIWILLFFTIANEFIFYWLHRSLHSKALYKYIHKQHHEFSGSVGYAAEYSHPLENIFVNQLSVMAGVLLLPKLYAPPNDKCHLLVFLIWIAVRLYETYEGHSGYSFLLGVITTITKDADHQHDSNKNDGSTCVSTIGKKIVFYLTGAYAMAHHDFHHTHNQGNFASPFMDWIFGTMDHYQNISGIDGYVQLKDKDNYRSKRRLSPDGHGKSD